jgi:hypothetical protein
MNKLFKPENLDKIIRSGIVLKSRKAYKNIIDETARTWFNRTNTNSEQYKLLMTNICSVRSKYRLHNPTPCSCRNSQCETCFLQANNYLNVLKYIKHNLKCN